MATILTPIAEHQVSTRDGLWMSAADAERVTGWRLKPEGMCLAERCVPLSASAVRDGQVDVAAFWTKLGGPVVGSEDGETWALGQAHAFGLQAPARDPLGAPADERNAVLEGLDAPDFTLPDVDGTPRSLSQLKGKKVFLATWASW